MATRSEFISSISHEIEKLNNSLDFSFIDAKQLKQVLRPKIANISKEFRLVGDLFVPFSFDGGKVGYIDAVWFLDSIPIAAFTIEYSFRFRSLWKLLKYNSQYKFLLFYGIISDENQEILKSIDPSQSITLLQYPNYKRSRSRSIKTKIHGQSISTILSSQKYDANSLLKLNSSVLFTYHLYKKGYSIREIAFERNLAEETIANHLIKVMKAGESVILDNLIPQEKQEIILKTADSLNTTRLKPIKERLGDDYSWDEIRLVLAYRERYDLFD